jgi:hypothetical protein
MNRRRLLWLSGAGAAAVAAITGGMWAFAGVSIVHNGPSADDTTGIWTGSSIVTMSRKSEDFGVGYTMRADFWFRVDANGEVHGNASAVYQPTFDATGMNNKIVVAKSVVSGALGLLPGGQLAIFKSAIDAGKAGTNVSLAGLAGVVGKFSDPKPVRAGAITGSLRGRALTLRWADPGTLEAGIPATISFKYINKEEPISNQTLQIQAPWRPVATVDPDSDGRFAVGQEQQGPAEKDGVTDSLFAYWSATRVA